MRASVPMETKMLQNHETKQHLGSASNLALKPTTAAQKSPIPMWTKYTNNANASRKRTPWATGYHTESSLQKISLRSLESSVTDFGSAFPWMSLNSSEIQSMWYTRLIPKLSIHPFHSSIKNVKTFHRLLNKYMCMDPVRSSGPHCYDFWNVC